MSQPFENPIDISAVVLESSPDAIVAVDLSGTIISWNAAAERMTGYSSAQAIGTKLKRIIPEELHADADSMLERVRRGETVEARDVNRLREDGSTVPGNLVLAPIRDADGTVCGSVGILHDISERQAVDTLLRRNERLASIGTLAAGVAHEINNPVGGILMAAQYAGRSLDRDDARQIVEKALADIEVDAKRCGDIIRRLLTFANEERGIRTPCDINTVIDSAILLARRRLDDGAPPINFTRNPRLPDLELSEPEIERALINLINNAVESGATEIFLEATAGDDDARLVVVVRDNGVGIPDDLRERLFDPFLTTKRKQGGAGLGLSLVHAIITDHGGAVRVASSLTGGTTITVELPVLPTDSG